MDLFDNQTHALSSKGDGRPDFQCERFVFLADSRGNSTSDLINTTVLTAINNQILALSPRPSFVIFGGDQAGFVRIRALLQLQR